MKIKNYRFLIFFLHASISLITIFYFWSQGTSRSEYEANFKIISGKVKKPYVIVFESFNVKLMDSLENSPYLMSKFESLLSEHELYRPYQSFKNSLFRETNKIDSLDKVPSKTQWETLKSKNERVISTIDTVFYSEAKYPIEIPIKFSIVKSVYAVACFSLEKHADRLTINFPNEKKTNHSKQKIDVDTLSFRDIEYVEENFQKLKEFTSQYEQLSIKRLKYKRLSANVYKAWNEKNQLVFEDKKGLKRLKYNDNFVLWYEDWLVKIIIGTEAFIFLMIFFELMAYIRKRLKPKSSKSTI